MRAFEVAVKKERSADNTRFVWPNWWGEVYEKVDVVAYQDAGKAVEGALCVADNKTASAVEAKNDSRVTWLNSIDANARGRKWKPRVTRITDAEKVMILLAKFQRGETLSLLERNALNPADSTPGINESAEFDIEKIARMRGDVLISPIVIRAQNAV